MSVKEIYDKENELVQENTRKAHQMFIDAIESARMNENMSVSELTIGAGVGPAQTYRMLNPNENLSLLSMQRFAAPLGKKAVVTLVDIDEG